MPLRPTDVHSREADAAILKEMQICEGDAKAAWQALCEHGVLHESYSPEAVLSRFRHILKTTS